MDALFERIRAACSPAAWSRGVELVRADAVVGVADEGADDDAITVRVSTRGGMVSPAVTLYPNDDDWECECSSPDDACEHVAAAAIAVRKARRDGTPLSRPAGAAGTLRYAFGRVEGGGLAFDRSIVTRGADGDAHEVPLRHTLDAIARGRVDGPTFVASAADLAVERALGAKRRGTLTRAEMERLIEPLSRCADVRLDGRPIRVSTERATLHGRLDDAEGGFVLSVRPDPTISERFSNEAVLCGDVLKMTASSGLSGRELEDLPRGRLYAYDRATELVTEVLPSLAARIPVEILTDKLPESERQRPRIAVEVEERDGHLSVLATLVYGDPPTARIDAGRIVHLQGVVPIRDEAAEEREVRRLRDELGLSPGRRVELAPGDAIAFAGRLGAFSGEVRGDAHRAFRREPALVPRVDVDGVRIAVRFESPLGETGGEAPVAATRRASAAAVFRAWREGASEVRLAGGGYAALPVDWLERHGRRVADLLAARAADGTLPPAVLPDLGRLCDDLDAPRPPELERLAPLFERFDALPRATLPDDLRADLRTYQRYGVDWLAFLRRTGLGALLADDMGLGKTLQALCVLEAPSLVVAPTSMLHTWRNEIERFRPGLRVNLYHGPSRALDDDADVTLTSYALLRLDQDGLCEREWACVVLDEAQNVKNPQSQVAQSAYALRARARIALTGTPVENRLEELWSQLHFLNRGLLGGLSDFRERYVGPIAAGDAGVAERLRERIRPFVLRRLKRDVAPELPPRTEVVLRFELSDDERDVYRAVEAATVRPVVERLQAGGDVLAALEALLRLRQAVCHPALVPGQHADGSSKVSLLVERLAQAVDDGHKALVFSQWTTLLDLVEPHVSAAGIAFERLDGATRERGDVVDRFQDADGAPVMLVSLRAGGTGLNLTAADHVFLLDPWWNPAVEDQAADRAHRIGQTRPVVVHRLIGKDTVEERILELHARKRAMSDAVTAGAAQADGLTRDDLLSLLG